MRAAIIADARRFDRTDRPLAIGAATRMAFAHIGLQALFVYRFGQWIRRRRRRPWGWVVFAAFWVAYWALEWAIRLAYDIHLDPSAEIGPGLYIGHFGGIDVRNCRIGSHCSLQQQVRIGATDGSNEGPVIGDRVWIGAHARVLGRMSIGDGATIGAGAVVTGDVASRCLVLGNPARVAAKDYDNGAFL
ncbi:MAG: hypothetical protein U1F08_02480 [Steroidobacteraceae bacterium]